MGQFIDDLFKAQPYSLCIIAGLVLICVGVVGSIKSYIDPGKYGRMAAIGIGVILLTIGFTLYARQPAPPAAGATPAATTSICTFDAGPQAGTTVQLPETELGPVGGPCHDNAGNKGVLVAPDTPITARGGRRTPRDKPGEPSTVSSPTATPSQTLAATPSATAEDAPRSRVCKFSFGPLAGSVHSLPRATPQLIGKPCHDLRGNSGTIVPEDTPLTP